MAGGLLGLLWGPVGGIVGVLVGHQYDVWSDGSSRAAPRLSQAQVEERFFRITFQVMGHIAKSDGRVSEREIQAARRTMDELRLTPEQVRGAIECFTAGKAPEFRLDMALDELRAACARHPQLTRVFLEIQMRAALAGSDLRGASRERLLWTARRLGISGMEVAHMEYVLRIRAGSFRDGGATHGAAVEAQTLASAYRVLEVDAQASNDEVTKAYRRQMSRHHPDKLKTNGLPDSMIEHAKQRTQQIIEAWELIKARRGL